MRHRDRHRETGPEEESEDDESDRGYNSRGFKEDEEEGDRAEETYDGKLLLPVCIGNDPATDLPGHSGKQHQGDHQVCSKEVESPRNQERWEECDYRKDCPGPEG